ncbi:hypothetical protein GCM10007108_07020 [Thermogymnomonas acidicola]|uniref:Uncharacterized protein n=1 Tax=Thermogymnomonas acidicola TaxID=399579 RepID=A0AA37F9S9_9ARCH|nr:hypothetical protein [Thermogymnomonas acidicola]GGM71517.1 hypothetical protein GCM10007108_07020 [Thermogymnomonas acidicola]
MSRKPSIELQKLRKYVMANSSYSLEEKGREIVLRFVPNSPEQMAHFPEGQPVEHLMFGYVEGGRVFFYRFTTISSFGETTTELDGEDDPVMEWLKYI